MGSVALIGLLLCAAPNLSKLQHILMCELCVSPGCGPDAVRQSSVSRRHVTLNACLQQMRSCPEGTTQLATVHLWHQTNSLMESMLGLQQVQMFTSSC